MKKTYVIYHSADFDGIFCREIARKFLGNDNVEYVGWNYGDPEPLKGELDGSQTLYILDLSVPSLMDYPNLIWIDHHKSAIEKYDGPPPLFGNPSPEQQARYDKWMQIHSGSRIPGYRIDGVAACRLAWQWFTCSHDATDSFRELPVKADYVERIVKEPRSVRLAGEYDIWDKRDPNAEVFQFGLRSKELLTGDDWDWLLMSPDEAVGEYKLGMVNVTIVKMLQDGRLLQRYQQAQNASVIENMGFSYVFEGLTFLCCNAALYNSHLFTAGLNDTHDACLGFKWKDNRWHVSLYHAPGREHHDLSLIAVKYGGGGHRGACGFTSDALPWI